MPLIPNWIDIPNQVSAMEDNTSLCDAIVRDGNNLWMAGVRLAFNNERPWFKSTDNGATWVDQNLDVGGNSPSNPPKFLPLRRVLVIRQRIVHYIAASNNDNKIWWSTFDLDNPTTPWSAWTSIFSGEYLASLVSDGTLWAGVRPSDDAIILAFQSANGFRPAVAVKKYDGSSWTSLDLIETSTYSAVFHSGVIDPASSHAHLFFNWYNTDVDDVPNLSHAAVDSSDDSITSVHQIEAAIEDAEAFGSYIHGPGAVNGTTIAFGYGKDVQTNAYGSSTYGTFKVAIGDMSGDPLNPSWTLTTVNGTPDLTLDYEGFKWIPCAVGFNGFTLEAYYITPYPVALSPFPSDWNIWKSSYTSSWSTPVKWYEPSTDTSLDSHRSSASDGGNLDNVVNFQLLGYPVFTNGVGIMVDVGQTYAGYQGPSALIPNYASAGGALAGPGNYGSA